VHVALLRGKLSFNLKLEVTFVDHGILRELWMFSHDQERSHKVSTEIVHVCHPNYPQSLAFVFSMEKVHGLEDNVVIRIVHIEKWDQTIMSEYDWNPDGRPMEGSTDFTPETVFLVRKKDSLYCRVNEYEILNTEVRTQLFMHSFGYYQAHADFGNVCRYLESADQRRVNYLSVMGSEQNMRSRLNANI
jgi:hypothetical protein